MGIAHVKDETHATLKNGNVLRKKKQDKCELAITRVQVGGVVSE